MEAVYTSYDMQTALIVGAAIGTICGAIIATAWHAWRSR